MSCFLSHSSGGQLTLTNVVKLQALSAGTVSSPQVSVSNTGSDSSLLLMQDCTGESSQSVRAVAASSAVLLVSHMCQVKHF